MFEVIIFICLGLQKEGSIESKCFYLKDLWQPYKEGYITEKECEYRLKTVTEGIKANFELYHIEKAYCKHTSGRLIKLKKGDKNDKKI